MKDNQNNTFEIEAAYVDMKSNKLVGENITVNSQ